MMKVKFSALNRRIQLLEEDFGRLG